MVISKQNIIIVNFLNKRAIDLLTIINKISPAESKLLRDMVSENNDNRLMSNSTFYIYMDLLVDNKLIDKSKYRKKIGGYIYKINNKGKTFLQSFDDSDIEFYNKLCFNPDKQKIN